MWKYYKIFQTKLKTEFAYRFEYIVGIFASLLTISVLWFIWKAVYSSNEVIAGISFQTMITYIIISTLIQNLVRSDIEYNIEDDARTGYIAMILAKPIRYMPYCFSCALGEYASDFLKRVIPILVISFFILKIEFPASLWFIPSLILGILIMYEISFVIGIISYWTEGSIWGFVFIKDILTRVLSGSIIPIYFFPIWFQQVLMVLPFQAIFHSPISIYIGKIAGYEIYKIIFIQIVWLLLFGLISYILWEKTQKKLMVFGG